MGLDITPNPQLSGARQQAAGITRRRLLLGALALTGLELASACQFPQLKPEAPNPPTPAARFNAVPPTRAPIVRSEQYFGTTDREDDTIAVNSLVAKKDFDEIFALPSGFLTQDVRSQVDRVMAALLSRRDHVRPNYLELKTVKVVDVYRVTETDGVRQWRRGDRDEVIGEGRVLVARMTGDTKRDEGDIWMRKRDAGNNPGSMALYVDGSGLLKPESYDITPTDPVALSRKVLLHTADPAGLAYAREGWRIKNVQGEVKVGADTLKYKVSDRGQIVFDVFR